MSNETATLDGLCFIGTLRRVERRTNKETGEYYPFATAFFGLDSGLEKRIDLQSTLRNDAGDIELRAFQILLDAEPGTRWQLNVFGKISKPADDGRQFINYVAANAIPA